MGSKYLDDFEYEPEQVVEPSKRITPVQDLFLQAYLLMNSPSKAAERAGLSESWAHELLTKPHIKARLDELKDLRLVDLKMTAIRTAQLISYIAHHDITELFTQDKWGSLHLKNLEQLPRHLTYPIKKVTVHSKLTSNGDEPEVIEQTVTVETIDKLAALKIGLKHHADLYAMGVQSGELGPPEPEGGRRANYGESVPQPPEVGEKAVEIMRRTGTLPYLSQGGEPDDDPDDEA